jgi:hypothetical protein
MVKYPVISISAVEAEVRLDGKLYPACIRPEHDGMHLALGSFRPEEDTLIYARTGPYVAICIRDLDLVDALAQAKTTLPKPAAGGLQWFGEFWMVGGRAACDLPDERRLFESLSIATTRLKHGTRIAFSALLGPRRDPGDWPDHLSLELWFVVPDHEIDRFLLGAEANQRFRDLFSIRGCAHEG